MVTQQVQQMISFEMDDVEEEIKKHLFEQGVELNISICFEAVRNPFVYLETVHAEQKFYQENFNLIVSLI